MEKSQYGNIMKNINTTNLSKDMHLSYIHSRNSHQLFTKQLNTNNHAELHLSEAYHRSQEDGMPINLTDTYQGSPEDGTQIKKK